MKIINNINNICISLTSDIRKQCDIKDTFKVKVISFGQACPKTARLVSATVN